MRPAARGGRKVATAVGAIRRVGRGRDSGGVWPGEAVSREAGPCPWWMPARVDGPEAREVSARTLWSAVNHVVLVRMQYVLSYGGGFFAEGPDPGREPDAAVDRGLCTKKWRHPMLLQVAGVFGMWTECGWEGRAGYGCRLDWARAMGPRGSLRSPLPGVERLACARSWVSREAPAPSRRCST